MSKITVVNWNVGGAKLLQLREPERSLFQAELNEGVANLCARWKPDVVSLQEATQYRVSGGPLQSLITAPPGYHYAMVPIHDTILHSHPVRWTRYRSAGGWGDDDYIGQGGGFLWREDLNHASIWEFEQTSTNAELATESIPTDTGLFTGDRDTEPRAAIVAHFLFADPDSGARRSVFVANLHLSTLQGEREGKPSVDALGVRVRERQLGVVLDGVVSRHVVWSQMLPEGAGPTRPVWIISGDLNAPPDSDEIAKVLAAGFRDASPNKGIGNKTSGLGNEPTHTVDFIFANYLDDWRQIEDDFETEAAEAPEPDLSFRSSDHYPTIANIPLSSGRGSRE